MSQEISFRKWNCFQANLVSSLNERFTDTDSADVTLVSDDQIPFQAHRLVISASSPVLKNLLLDNPSSHPLIYLKNVNQQELGSILQFMYFGEATVDKNRTDEFLINARDLQMKQLADTHVIKSEIEGDGHSDIVIKNQILKT